MIYTNQETAGDCKIGKIPTRIIQSTTNLHIFYHDRIEWISKKSIFDYEVA